MKHRTCNMISLLHHQIISSPLINPRSTWWWAEVEGVVCDSLGTRLGLWDYRGMWRHAFSLWLLALIHTMCTQNPVHLNPEDNLCWGGLGLPCETSRPQSKFCIEDFDCWLHKFCSFDCWPHGHFTQLLLCTGCGSNGYIVVLYQQSPWLLSESTPLTSEHTSVSPTDHTLTTVTVVTIESVLA